MSLAPGKTRLIRADIETSRIGFGGSRLHYLARSRDRQALLNRAFDLGMCHFDVAPAYGHGLAEAELGTFLRGKRDSTVIATKYGIPAAALPSTAIRVSKQLARPSIAIHALAKRVGMASGLKPVLTADGLVRSLHASLRRLRCERIDIYFIHDPSLACIQDLPALIGKLDLLRSQGHIGTYGLSGNFSDCKAIWEAARCPDLVIQTAENAWDASLIPDITFGILSKGAQSFRRETPVAASDVGFAIRTALRRRVRGVALVSTTRREHLDETMAAAAESETRA
jgi:D-threo-aldose 1-dehydrogenase